ncbi:MAG: transcription antitermination factor NusB [Candidatus Omnitrophica bacterium]|nr:transcription antitermination factor NusB [Candidatus Omnitrophota bacterium]MBD3269430.1 transcription antitermination factor NusB [Candidatus Omnitrophota bacterium]
MRFRSKARECALCVLYQTEVARMEPDEALSNYLDNNPQKKEVAHFSSLLIRGIHSNIASLDLIIKKYVKNWEIERLAIIDRNILRIACFELLYTEDIPPKVSINEAIELAKKFGDIDSPRFVNGVLDKIYKTESPKREDSAFKQK